MTTTAKARFSTGGSLQNRLMEISGSKAPAIGNGATIVMFTDRHAATIVEATAKTVVVQQDSVARADSNGMSEDQRYTFTPNPNAVRVAYSLRNTGQWIRVGESTKGGQVLLIGHRDEYHDYSF